MDARKQVTIDTLIAEQRSVDDLIDGKKIKFYRKMIGLSQIELAAKLGIDQSRICHIEAGRYPAKKHVPIVKKMFDEWRELEVFRLKERISYLKKI